MNSPEMARSPEVVPQEIERKFLVDFYGSAQAHIEAGGINIESTPIIQGYLAIDDEDSSEVRIRNKAGKYTLTTKLGSGLIRGEAEVSLTAEQFDSLWPLTNGKVVEKVRHHIPHGERIIELDVYTGPLDGLVVAEIEFISEDEANDYEQPAWFGLEVTEDPKYKNQALARRNQTLSF